MIMMSDRTGRAWRTSWAGALDREAEAMIEARRVLATVESEHCGDYQRLTWLGDWSGEVAGLISAAVADGGLLDQMAGGAR